MIYREPLPGEALTQGNILDDRPLGVSEMDVPGTSREMALAGESDPIKLNP